MASSSMIMFWPITYGHPPDSNARQATFTRRMYLFLFKFICEWRDSLLALSCCHYTVVTTGTCHQVSSTNRVHNKSSKAHTRQLCSYRDLFGLASKIGDRLCTWWSDIVCTNFALKKELKKLTKVFGQFSNSRAFEPGHVTWLMSDHLKGTLWRENTISEIKSE